MATDQVIDRSGELAEFSEQTIERLNEILPDCWSHGNPVDVLGDAQPDRFAKALEILLNDKGVDAVLVILTPQAMTDSTGTAQAVGRAAAKGRKPVLAAWMGGRAVQEGVQVLNRANIPTYPTPDKAVRGVHAHGLLRPESEYAPRHAEGRPRGVQDDRRRLRTVFDTALPGAGNVLGEDASKALLETYDIPVTKPLLARRARRPSRSRRMWATRWL